MTDYRRQLEAAVHAVRIHSPTSFSWFGKMSGRAPRSVARLLTPQTARSFLQFTLQMRLYRDFYCRGGALPETRETGAAASAHAGRSFVAGLQAANSGRGHWQAGWTIVERDGDAYIVERDRLSVRVTSDGCRPAESDAAGGSVELLVPKALLAISPGYYMALGDAPFDGADADLRLYWNLRPEGAARLLDAATGRLNRARIPFRLKVLSEPAQYHRCDAGVLYVAQRDYPRLELDLVYRDVGDGLKADVPALTKPLAPGCALAEDPGEGRSFGLHRCGLVAEGLVRAFEAGKRSPAERLEQARAQFSGAGLSAARPYLNPGSHDRYELRRRRIPVPGSGGDPAGVPQPVTPGSLLETANAIGRRIGAGAIRHRDLCNWVGASPAGATGEPTGVSYQALGPDLYGGTAGIALFLAELHRATGSGEFHELACRAIRHSLGCAREVAPRYRLSLHQGWVGIAYAAAYVGLLLDESSLTASALELLGRVGKAPPDDHEVDLLAGSAGAIVGLLTLREVFGQDRLLSLAATFGDDLIARAEGDSETGYSWPSPRYPRQPNLLGLSHGAAGIGYALAELAAATGLDRYRDAATRAFVYERNWFQTGERNWPDFRDLTRGALRHGGALPTTTFWCHGAPGIALSRLRCSRILADASLLEEAVVALGTTRRATERWLRGAHADFSLCHGLTGNADILLYAARRYPRLEENLAAVDAVAMTGSHGRPGPDDAWPCGTGGGETPALMLGLAGIGLFYLRRLDARVPPLLVLEPEASRRRLIP